MPRLYSARETVKVLGKAGFVEISQKGSHIKMRGIRDGKMQTVIIPNHKEIPKGTFGSILKQAEMTRQEFDSLV
jgi:predicted RNA binding protein YcfA (HicA-like mRNA interferase family)